MAGLTNFKIFLAAWAALSSASCLASNAADQLAK